MSLSLLTCPNCQNPTIYRPLNGYLNSAHEGAYVPADLYACLRCTNKICKSCRAGQHDWSDENPNGGCVSQDCVCAKCP